MNETVMKERCAGCAFRTGTEAAKSPWTSMLAALCVKVGTPFECHGIGADHICKGWLDAFEAKLAAGDYEILPEWKRTVYFNLIEVLHDYQEAMKRGEQFDSFNAVRRAALKDLPGEAVPQ